MGVYGLSTETVVQLLGVMNRAFKNALVHGSEKYVEAFEGKTDWKDQHVAAGALKVSQSEHGGRPVVLVTHNATDLPQYAFEGSPVLRVRPDTLLTMITKTWPPEVDRALTLMLNRFKDPKISETVLLDNMVGSGCSNFADELAKLWGYDLVDELSAARQEQLPKSMKPAPPAKKTAAAKAAKAKQVKPPKAK